MFSVFCCLLVVVPFNFKRLPFRNVLDALPYPDAKEGVGSKCFFILRFFFSLQGCLDYFNCFPKCYSLTYIFRFCYSPRWLRRMTAVPALPRQAPRPGLPPSMCDLARKACCLRHLAIIKKNIFFKEKAIKKAMPKRN